MTLTSIRRSTPLELFPKETHVSCSVGRAESLYVRIKPLELSQRRLVRDERRVATDVVQTQPSDIIVCGVKGLGLDEYGSFVLNVAYDEWFVGTAKNEG